MPHVRVKVRWHFRRRPWFGERKLILCDLGSWKIKWNPYILGLLVQRGGSSDDWQAILRRVHDVDLFDTKEEAGRTSSRTTGHEPSASAVAAFVACGFVLPFCLQQIPLCSLPVRVYSCH